MNKALILIEALENIITEVTTKRYPEGGADEVLNRVHGLAEDAVNMVGGREEIENMFEDLRVKAVDLDIATDHVNNHYLSEEGKSLFGADVVHLMKCIYPVLAEVDDLTDLGVSGA